MLQARNPGDAMAAHERRCFVERTGLPEDSIAVHDLLAHVPSLAEVRRHEALFMGGSGEFNVSQRNAHWFPALFELLSEVATVGHPTFACCFGYHCFVAALGGELIHEPAAMEVGTYEVTLTEHGRADPLIGQLPARFAAQMGHKDRPVVQPAITANLAASERSPLQALRISGQPVWAVQFHPELTRETNLERYRAYIHRYSDPAFAEVPGGAEARFQESHLASSLLRLFLETVFQ